MAPTTRAAERPTIAILEGTDSEGNNLALR